MYKDTSVLYDKQTRTVYSIILIQHEFLTEWANERVSVYAVITLKRLHALNVSRKCKWLLQCKAHGTVTGDKRETYSLPSYRQLF